MLRTTVTCSIYCQDLTCWTSRSVLLIHDKRLLLRLQLRLRLIKIIKYIRIYIIIYLYFLHTVPMSLVWDLTLTTFPAKPSIIHYCSRSYTNIEVNCQDLTFICWCRGFLIGWTWYTIIIWIKNLIWSTLDSLYL